MKNSTIKNHIWWIIPVVLALAVRWTVLKNGLVYDDWYLFETELPRFKSVLQAFFPYDLWQMHVHYYRPLPWLSFMITRSLSGGYDPLWYHFVPYLLHAINTALVYRLTSLLLGERRDAAVGALVAACVFAVHPAQTEVVAWISGLVEVWLMAFTLTSLILFILYRRRPSKFYYLLGALLAFFLALITKETAIMLVCIIPLYDFLLGMSVSMQNNEGKSLLVFVRKGVVAWAGYGCVVMLYLILRYKGMGSALQIGSVTTLPLQQIPLQIIGAFGFYLQTLILPLKTHSYILQVPQTFGFIVGSLLWILAFVIFAALKMPDKKLVVFHLVFFLFFLAPALYVTLGTVSKTFLAERYLYLPSYGYSFLVGWFYLCILNFFEQSRYKKVLLTMSFSVILGLLSLRSVQAAQIWQTEESFFQNAVLQNPKSPGPYSALGAAYYRQADYSKAISYLNQAVALGPSDYKQLVRVDDKELFSHIYSNLGAVYQILGNLDLAETNYEQAITIQPHPGTYYNLGQLYLQRAISDVDVKGVFYYQKAADICKKAIDMDLHDSKGLYCLVVSYHGLAKEAEAQQYYYRLSELDSAGELTQMAKKILFSAPFNREK